MTRQFWNRRADCLLEDGVLLKFCLWLLAGSLLNYVYRQSACLAAFFNWQAGLEILPATFCLSAGSFVLNYDVSQAVYLPACILRIDRQGWKRVKTAWALRIGWKLPAKFCLPAGSFIFNYDVSQAVCLSACILGIGGQSRKKVKTAFAPRIGQKLPAIIYLPAGSIVLNYGF